MLKLNEPSLTPLETEMERASDFARKLAACGVMQKLLERFEDCEITLLLAESDEVFAKENQEILPTVMQDMKELEDLIADFAMSNLMFHCPNGISA